MRAPRLPRRRLPSPVRGISTPYQTLPHLQRSEPKLASDVLLQHLGHSSQPAHYPGRIVKIRSTTRRRIRACAYERFRDWSNQPHEHRPYAHCRDSGAVSSPSPASGSPGAGSHEAGRHSTSNLQSSKRVNRRQGRLWHRLDGRAAMAKSAPNTARSLNLSGCSCNVPKVGMPTSSRQKGCSAHPSSSSSEDYPIN